MRYDKVKYSALKNCVTQLSKYIDFPNEVSEAYMWQIYFAVNSHFSEGQKHNSLMTDGKDVKRLHSVQGNENYFPVISEAINPIDSSLNDSHITTALRSIFKEINRD